MLINAIRGHLGEFWHHRPAGRHRVADLVNLLQSADDTDVPALAREALQSLFAELSALEMRIKAIEAVIMREHRSNAVSRRLATIPGIGPITASAITGTIADPFNFQVWPRTRGMDRAGPTTALEWWQAQDGPCLQTG
jgi:transposase